MRRILRLAILTMLVLPLSSNAQKIILKHGFFSGWKFSTDGVNYSKVGISGNSLKPFLRDNEAALNELSAHKSNKVVANVVGIPGGAMMGWGLGAAMWGDMNDFEIICLTVGTPLVIIATIFELKGNAHLKRAVRIYNGEEMGLLFDLQHRYPEPTDDHGLYLALKLEF